MARTEEVGIEDRLEPRSETAPVVGGSRRIANATSAPLLLFLLLAALLGGGRGGDTVSSEGPTKPSPPAVVPATHGERERTIAPEAPTNRVPSRSPAVADEFMVATANPHATQAGVEIVMAGGNAVDAAIAAQMVLNVVEPQSSGIGGGGFLLYFDAKTQRVEAYDGRETAPMRATPDLFLTDTGEPKAFYDAVVGGLSVGVPGLLRMLEWVHWRHGRLAWKRLFTPAIELCESGFPISPRLHDLLAKDAFLRKEAVAGAFFYDAQGNPHPVGYRLKNRELAATFRKIAEEGSSALMLGEIAEDIVRTVRAHPRNPGRMIPEDLAAYHPVERQVLCGPYREYQVCGFPPPTSGGVTVLQMLGMLEHYRLGSLSPTSPEVARFLAEAGRLAFADRARYLADPDFVGIPIEALLSPDYLARMAHHFGQGGKPPLPVGNGSGALPRRASPPSHEGPSTTQISIVDREGNAVSMTSSIENAFGSRLMVRGFLLNNELTDFSFVPAVAGEMVANRVQPGKRPRSSMAPTMIFDREGRLSAVLGSPGGPRIIGYVVQAVTALLDWHLDPQATVELPHLLGWGDRIELEADTAAENLAHHPLLQGKEIEIRPMTSGLQIVWIERKGGRIRLLGGTDPRREGVAAGR
ncbi:MAG: gamma-glutamyltransferase [Deltaproteobacteria bacterium]|nr:MAG: gamma-glutamyltransferase [Deltaproteobacteria bacterium]